MNETWDDIETINPFLEKMGGDGGCIFVHVLTPVPPSPFYPSFPYKKLLTTTEVHQVRWIIYILPLTKNPIIRKKIIFWIKREVNGRSFLYPLILTSFSGYRGTLRLRLSVSNYAYKPRESDLPVTQSRT